jgi:hypothetical protein
MADEVVAVPWLRFQANIRGLLDRLPDDATRLCYAAVGTSLSDEFGEEAEYAMADSGTVDDMVARVLSAWLDPGPNWQKKMKEDSKNKEDGKNKAAKSSDDDDVKVCVYVRVCLCMCVRAHCTHT